MHRRLRYYYVVFFEEKVFKRTTTKSVLEGQNTVLLRGGAEKMILFLSTVGKIGLEI